MLKHLKVVAEPVGAEHPTNEIHIRRVIFHNEDRKRWQRRRGLHSNGFLMLGLSTQHTQLYRGHLLCLQCPLPGSRQPSCPNLRSLFFPTLTRTSVPLNGAFVHVAPPHLLNVRSRIALTQKRAGDDIARRNAMPYRLSLRVATAHSTFGRAYRGAPVQKTRRSPYGSVM